MSPLIVLAAVLRVALATGAEPAPPSPASHPGLAAGVRAASADPAFDGLTAAFAAGCADGSGTPVFWQADRLMNPASGTKLLTSAAALARFGASHAFTSEVAAAGPVRADGVITGPLVLRPSGAPDLQTEALGEIAAALKGLGVRRVEGDVLVELAGFAGPDLPPAFSQKQTDAAYRPRVPVLGVGDGAVTVTVKPGRRARDPVRVTTDLDRAVVPLGSSAETVAGKDARALAIRSGDARVDVTGQLGLKAPPQVVRLRLPDPAEAARATLALKLREAGVRVSGKVRLVTGPVAAPTTLVTHESMPIGQMIAVINIKSNNYWAEGLMRLLAEPPRSFEAGATAVTGLLASLFGLGPAEVRVVNGSGLYDATRISARGMLRLLVAHGGDGANAQAFRDSLARAGETGTLERRLKGLKGRVRAKTGTLGEALSLSGYVEREGACRLAFTALVEGALKDRTAPVVAAIDRWVEAMATP